MKQLPKHVLILTSLLAVNHIQAQDKPAQPNLVFIMADQWRGQAIGCLGVEPVKTPISTAWLPKASISRMPSAAIPSPPLLGEC